MSKKKVGNADLYQTRQSHPPLRLCTVALFLIAIIVPMVYIVIASFMDPVTLQNKGISFDFSKWSLDAYERVISTNRYGSASKTLFFIRLYSPSFPLP